MGGSNYVEGPRTVWASYMYVNKMDYPTKRTWCHRPCGHVVESTWEPVQVARIKTCDTCFADVERSDQVVVGLGGFLHVVGHTVSVRPILEAMRDE